MGFQGPLFRAYRRLYRMVFGRYQVKSDGARLPDGAVYLCRHLGASGPAKALAYAPIPMRPWVLSVFFDRAVCYQHYRTVTFRDRCGWGEKRSNLVARLIAAPFARLVRSAGGIPVYRQSLRIGSTFRQTAQALERGESVLIFPDVDYMSREDEIGALYQGFLLIENLYYKKTGRHVAFYPMHIARKRRALCVGEAVMFSGEKPYAQERDEVLSRLTEGLTRLARQYGE